MLWLKYHEAFMVLSWKVKAFTDNARSDKCRSSPRPAGEAGVRPGEKNLTCDLKAIFYVTSVGLATVLNFLYCGTVLLTRSYCFNSGSTPAIPALVWVRGIGGSSSNEAS